VFTELLTVKYKGIQILHIKQVTNMRLTSYNTGSAEIMKHFKIVVTRFSARILSWRAGVVTIAATCLKSSEH